VIGVYGRGSVEQDQTLLEDGLQVNQILRKSVSGPGFEAVVTKMAWLAKADLNLKSLGCSGSSNGAHYPRVPTRPPMQ
jgi:hypothetical protein